LANLWHLSSDGAMSDAAKNDGAGDGAPTSAPASNGAPSNTEAPPPPQQQQQPPPTPTQTAAPPAPTASINGVVPASPMQTQMPAQVRDFVHVSRSRRPSSFIVARRWRRRPPTHRGLMNPKIEPFLDQVATAVG